MKLIIVFNGEAPRKRDGHILNWNKRKHADGEDSIIELFESEYRDIMFEVFEFWGNRPLETVGGKTIHQWLDLGGNDSYWWYTRFSEKSPLRSDSFYEMLKFATFSRWLKDKKIVSINLIGATQAQVQVFEGLPIPIFSSEQVSAVKKSIFLPLLKELVSRARFCFQVFKVLGKKKQKGGEKRHLVTTYFPFVDVEQAKQGVFYSKYWGRANRWFSNQKDIDWLLLYVDGDLKYKDSLAYLKQLSNRNNTNNYFVLEQFLGLKDFVGVVFDILKLRIKGKVLLNTPKLWQYKEFNFFPLVESMLREDLYGYYSIENLFFRRCFQNLNRFYGGNLQSVLYTWENQSWEHIFQANTPDSVEFNGYQHTTVSKLNLRSFSHGIEYRQGAYSRRKPERLFVTGAGARDNLLDWDYPDSDLKIGEALRYAHLENRFGTGKRVEGRSRLLVVTGCYDDENSRLIELVKKAVDKLGDKNIEVFYKPHHFFPIEHLLHRFGENDSSRMLKQDMAQALLHVDMAICSFTTSATTEVAWLGLPLAILGPQNKINFNAMFGVAGVQMVDGANEVANFIQSPNTVKISPNYFSIGEGFQSVVKSIYPGRES